MQNELSFENLRIYTNADVIGTEIGGSVKNVMAIAAGMAAGFGLRLKQRRGVDHARTRGDHATRPTRRRAGGNVDGPRRFRRSRVDLHRERYRATASSAKSSAKGKTAGGDCCRDE